MNTAKEMNDAITKVYEQVNPVLAAVQATFPNEDICIRPEIGVDRDDDGKIVASLRSIQFTLGKYAQRDLLPEIVPVNTFNKDYIEATNLLKKLVRTYGPDICVAKAEELKKNSRFGPDVAETMKKVFQTVDEGCFQEKAIP